MSRAFLTKMDPALNLRIRELSFYRYAFERDLIRERTNAGLAAARARGRRGGRPRKLKTKSSTMKLPIMIQPGWPINDEENDDADPNTWPDNLPDMPPIPDIPETSPVDDDDEEGSDT